MKITLNPGSEFLMDQKKCDRFEQQREIEAEVPLENDIPSHLLQRYEKRIKLLSQENKVSKFCMDAGFAHVVEIGQYFMTKDTEEQFFVRDTLPRSDESSQPKGWIQGNTRIGPVLEIPTSLCTKR